MNIYTLKCIKSSSVRISIPDHIYDDDISSHVATGDSTIYCRNHDGLNRELAYLHQLLLSGNRDAQIEIDRRIYAVIAVDNGWLEHDTYKHIPLLYLMPEPCNVIQYHNLPDLLRFLTQGATRQSWSGNLYEMLVHNSLPCLKKGRMFHNPITNDKCTNLTPCVHILLGTLLGLYPTSTKKPVFEVRKQIIGFIHTIATSKRDKQYKFLMNIPNLLKLCFMEYIVNASSDFCPSDIEYYKQIRGMDTFYKICPTVCDNFRCDNLQKMEWVPILENWHKMDVSAVSIVERFGRTCKFRIQKNENMSHRYSHARRVITKWRKDMQATQTENTDNEKQTILSHVLKSHFTPYNGMLRHVIQDKNLNMNQYAVIESIQQNIQCYMLPYNIVIDTCKKMYNTFMFNPQKLYSKCKLHACLWCIQKTPYDINNNKLRLNVMTDKLSCTICNDDTPVISIDCLGRLVCIGDKTYYVCPCCMSIQQWTSTGTELTQTQCNHNAIYKSKKQPNKTKPTNNTFHDTMRNSSSIDDRECVMINDSEALSMLHNDSKTRHRHRRHKTPCLVCNRVLPCTPMRILHVPAKRDITLYFCNTHTPPQFWMKYVYDTTSLQRFIIEQRKHKVHRKLIHK